MQDKNICRFIPKHNDLESIHTFHFVLETGQQVYEGLKSQSMYRMHLVTSGTGTFYTPGKREPLKEGDIFIAIPSVPFAIESGENLEYMYISFLGARANMIMDQLKINGQNCLFHDFSEVKQFWTASLNAGSAFFDMRSESVLLYTFSVMGTRFLKDADSSSKSQTATAKMKKYIDDHFSDTEFSLEKMGTELSYNKKYISTTFKNQFRVGVIEYLNTVRIQHSCTLMQQGFTSMKDIASLCGFKDPLYFSRVFKNQMGVTPREQLDFYKKSDTLDR